MLIDSHCHLNYPEIQQNFASVLENANLADVAFMQTICTKKSEFGAVLKIANDNSNIFASVGTHPLNIKQAQDLHSIDFSKQELIEASKHSKIIGIGETGLDYHYEKNQDILAQQRASFAKHIEACQETGLPIIVHTREAEGDTIKLLQTHMEKRRFKGLIHCFTGSQILAKAALDIGMYISVSGIITFKNASELREVVRDVPLNRLLIETDSPYLAPVPYRGKSCQPSYVEYVAKTLAEIKNTSLAKIAEITTANFFSLFDKAGNQVN